MEFRNSSEPTGVDIAQEVINYVISQADGSSGMIKAGIVGGSGYTGGELLRLLHAHPHGSKSRRSPAAGQDGALRPFSAHPPEYAQAVSSLKFIHPDALAEPATCYSWRCRTELSRAAISIATPRWRRKLIDLVGRFPPRLNRRNINAGIGEAHPGAAVGSGRFVYGLPEINREQLRGADFVSGVGCNATAVNLALAAALVCARACCIEPSIEIKVGSSEGGNKSNAGSHHPVRSGAVRTYKATGHRHLAEVQMILGCEIPIHFAVTAIEMVRGRASAGALLPQRQRGRA